MAQRRTLVALLGVCAIVLCAPAEGVGKQPSRTKCHRGSVPVKAQGKPDPSFCPGGAYTYPTSTIQNPLRLAIAFDPAGHLLRRHHSLGRRREHGLLLSQ